MKRRRCGLESLRRRCGANRQADRVWLRRDIGLHGRRDFRRSVETAACGARRGSRRIRAARSVGVCGVGLLGLVQGGAVVLRRSCGRKHHGKNRRQRGEAQISTRHRRSPSPVAQPPSHRWPDVPKYRMPLAGPICNAVRRHSREEALHPLAAQGSIARSLQGEDVDRAALRNVRILAGKQQVQAPLHPRRVDTPAGLDGDVLLAAHREGDRHAVDA
jgi:hypothetical protein